MSVKFNNRLLLWGLGAVQPASPSEVIGFLKLVYPDVTAWPDIDFLRIIFNEWLDRKYVIELNKKYEIFSLTSAGNHALGYELRVHRDKARVTLLRAVYDANLASLGDVAQDSDGDSPSTEASSALQEGSRPVNSGSEPSRTESTRLRARIYWPRVSEQLLSVGLDRHTSNIPSYRYRYCSFPTLRAIKQASNDNSDTQDLTISQLGLCIGVSPRLLTSFVHKPENHYRTFRIGKKGGGSREISSPRFFLKSIQYWIKSYILSQFNAHNACHSYRIGKSIITNANEHARKSYVGNVDIEDFFGSIDKKMVFECLRKHGYGNELSRSIAGLVTFNNSLPQGAPTSPEISNAILFDFDERLFAAASNVGVTYTRYADDITLSGGSKQVVAQLIRECEEGLKAYGMRLNSKKTRIASIRSSQVVTGLVVNEKVQPSRVYRKRVRAIFHQAGINPSQYVGRLKQLQGYYSYLSAFDSLKDSKQLREYREVIRKLGNSSKEKVDG